MSELRQPSNGAMYETVHLPSINTNFYLNLMDFCGHDAVAVGFSGTVGIFPTNQGGKQEVLTLRNTGSYVSSVCWMRTGTYVAVGTSDSAVEICDVNTLKIVRTMFCKSSVIGSLAWSSNVVTSGCQSGVIFHHDIRATESLISSSRSHTGAVCGLHWSSDGKLLASGGKDCLVAIWTAAMNRSCSEALYTLQHKSPVKAVAWCPWKGDILATGGGVGDPSIRLWSITNGFRCFKNMGVKSEVAGIVWSEKRQALITGHGFANYQLVVWNYPTLQQNSELKGHTARILNLSINSNESCVASVAADKTLRLWRLESQASQQRCYNSKPGANHARPNWEKTCPKGGNSNHFRDISGDSFSKNIGSGVTHTGLRVGRDFVSKTGTKLDCGTIGSDTVTFNWGSPSPQSEVKPPSRLNTTNGKDGVHQTVQSSQETSGNDSCSLGTSGDFVQSLTEQSETYHNDRQKRESRLRRLSLLFDHGKKTEEEEMEETRKLAQLARTISTQVVADLKDHLTHELKTSICGVLDKERAEDGRNNEDNQTNDLVDEACAMTLEDKVKKLEEQLRFHEIALEKERAEKKYLQERLKYQEIVLKKEREERRLEKQICVQERQKREQELKSAFERCFLTHEPP